MRTFIPHTVLIGLLAAALPAEPVLAVDEIEISFDRKRLDKQVSRDGDMTVTSQDIVYDIELKNMTFDDMGPLVVKYMVFYEDKQPGKATDAVELWVTGEEKVEGIASRETAELTTKPVQLKKEQLDSGYYWTSGAKSRSRDRVIGVWCKVFDGEREVAEYIKPSSIARRHDWEE